MVTRDDGDIWTVLASTALGSRHVRTGQPNQDAARSDRFGTGADTVAVVAVADGHGGERYVRSDVGSRLAVGVACAVVKQLVDPRGDARSARQLERIAQRELIPRIVAQWRRECADHLAEAPFSDEEQARAGTPLETQPLVAYGATLLVAVLSNTACLLLQLGDGDCVVADRDGGAISPMPRDDRLIGGETTSLCLDGAERDFRVAAIEGSTTSLVLLATDGYGVAFEDPRWRQRVISDLLRELDSGGTEQVAKGLPRWLAQSAHVGGDDATVALAFRTGGAEPAGASRATNSNALARWGSAVLVALVGLLAGFGLAQVVEIDGSRSLATGETAPPSGEEDDGDDGVPARSEQEVRPADPPPTVAEPPPFDEEATEQADVTPALPPDDPEVEDAPHDQVVPSRAWLPVGTDRVIEFFPDPAEAEAHVVEASIPGAEPLQQPRAAYAWQRLWTISDGALHRDGALVSFEMHPALRFGALAVHNDHLWVASETSDWLLVLNLPDGDRCSLVPVTPVASIDSDVASSVPGPEPACRELGSGVG
jgi:hypothetical protein